MSLIALSTHSLVHQLGRCSYVFSLRLICPPLISVSVSLCSIHGLKASPAHIAHLASQTLEVVTQRLAKLLSNSLFSANFDLIVPNKWVRELG